jgi:hypothetical protein
MEPDQKRQELIQRAKETKQKQDARQSKMLDAVASGDDGIGIEKYETVQIGQLEAKVKAWLPGDAQTEIQNAYRLAQRENLDDAQESIFTMVEGMTTVTESLKHLPSGDIEEDKEAIREFWKGMYGQWGIQGFQEAAHKALEPANNRMDNMRDSANGFRADESGEIVRAGDRTVGDSPE